MAREPTRVDRTASGQSPAEPAEDLAEFLASVRDLPPPGRRGRLVFAIDATMSRQPTWDMALKLQADMFEAVRAIGGLEVQLVYFRGYGECRASRWACDAEALRQLMTGVDCRGGHTQIRKVLLHVRREAEEKRIGALVYVGDAMEESVDDLAALAGELAILGVPAFMFQEGSEQGVERAFREVARLSKGAYFRFDSGSASVLKELLAAVAAYAAGGRPALAARADGAGSGVSKLLLEQLPPAKPASGDG